MWWRYVVKRGTQDVALDDSHSNERFVHFITKENISRRFCATARHPIKRGRHVVSDMSYLHRLDAGLHRFTFALVGEEGMQVGVAQTAHVEAEEEDVDVEVAPRRAREALWDSIHRRENLDAILQFDCRPYVQ